MQMKPVKNISQQVKRKKQRLNAVRETGKPKETAKRISLTQNKSARLLPQQARIEALQGNVTDISQSDQPIRHCIVRALNVQQHFRLEWMGDAVPSTCHGRILHENVAERVAHVWSSCEKVIVAVDPLSPRCCKSMRTF